MLVKLEVIIFLMFFCRLAPFVYLYFSMNEAELGAGIDPGMAFNPFPYSILDDLNPQPFSRKSSSLTTRPD